MNMIPGVLLFFVVADTTAQQMLMTKPERFHLPAVIGTEVPSPPVQVLVRKEPLQEGCVRYRYRVVNRSPFPITSVVIGDDGTSSELPMAPVGFGDKGVPRSSVTSPTGWTFHVIDTEEDSLVQYEWRIGSQKQAILGGDYGDFTVPPSFVHRVVRSQPNQVSKTPRSA